MKTYQKAAALLLALALILHFPSQLRQQKRRKPAYL